jgi:hypothetical protein
METNINDEIFEQITKEIQTFPYQMQIEVLDFIGYLKNKLAIKQGRIEEIEWSRFSLAKAVIDMEDEQTQDYSEEDLKEKWL